ncbi:MAG: hypothetical protein JXR60_03255 [Bacteroidales bacterium]|nr:hypothetical protein [Bacteroidales bacterium]
MRIFLFLLILFAVNILKAQEFSEKVQVKALEGNVQLLSVNSHQDLVDISVHKVNPKIELNEEKIEEEIDLLKLKHKITTDEVQKNQIKKEIKTLKSRLKFIRRASYE